MQNAYIKMYLVVIIFTEKERGLHMSEKVWDVSEKWGLCLGKVGVVLLFESTIGPYEIC